MKHTVLSILSFFLYFNLSAQEILLPSLSIESNIADARMGLRVGTCGDLNNDGYKEIYSYTSSGETFIFNGSTSGYSSTPDLTISVAGNLPNEYSYGDLNHDNYDDFVVACDNQNNVFVYYGSAAGIASTPDVTLHAPENAGAYGRSVDATGDINGDGYNDLLVGQPRVDRGSGLYGKALVFNGSSTGIATTPSFTFTTIIGTLGYGTFMRYAGDVNNDGFDDVLIAAQELPTGPLLSSEFTELFLGSSTGLVTPSDWSVIGHVTSIEKAGDINNDGFDDVIFTLYDSDASQYSIELYTGNSTSLNNSTFYSKVGGFSGRAIGIGDFNDDGFDDILISNQNYSATPFFNQGKIDVHLSSSTGINATPRFTYSSKVTNANIGAINNVGDLNNDGFSDILLGWYKYSSPENLEGRMLLFNGKTSLSTNFSVDKTNSCLFGNTFTFTNQTSSDGTSYTWDFGDGNTSTAVNPVYSYTNAGTYTVTLTANNIQGHTSTSTKLNLITIKPIAPGGNYTLGGVSPDFATVVQVNNFFGCGYSGDVDISIRTGTYDDHLILNGTKNIGGNYSLTIHSEIENSSAVTIGHISLQNSSNIRVRYLSVNDDIMPFGPFPAQTLLIQNSISITFDSCKIYTSDHAPLLTQIDASNDIHMEKCFFAYRKDTTLINGFMDGTYISNSDGVYIDSSYFLMLQGHAIRSSNSKNIFIRYNNLRGKNTTPFTSTYGILFSTVENFTILSNRINRIYSSIAIGGTPAGNNYNLIANNVIGYQSVVGSGNAIEINNSYKIKIYHNTVNLPIPFNSSFYNWGLKMNNSDLIVIKNNIFKTNFSSSSCFNWESCTNIESDYNVLNGQILIGSNFPITDLNTWQAQKKLDLNSIDDLIGFSSLYELIPSSNIGSVNEAGFFQSEVPFDINGTPRNTSSVDLGAYNVTPTDTLHFAYNKNIELFTIINDSTFMGNNIIQISITNNKPFPVDSIYISYQIDDGTVVTELWKGLLNQFDTITYSFTTPFVSNRGKIYNADAWVNLTSHYKDSHPENDTTHKFLYQKLGGAYTVGGINPDFIDLQTANYALKACKVASPVTFEIRPGNYVVNNYYLENGPVTFRSSTGNPDDVQLQLNRINRNDITIKRLTIITNYGETTPPYGGVDVYICNNIHIDSCKIIPGNSRTGLALGPYSRNIKISNCTFSGFNFGYGDALSTSAAISITRYPGSSPNYHFGNLEISNCHFDSSKIGIVFDADFGIYQPDSFFIKNNSFYKSEYAIKLNSVTGIKNILIDGNIMDSVITGIDCSVSEFSNSIISNNKIISTYYAFVGYYGGYRNLLFYNNIMKGQGYGSNGEVCITSSFSIGNHTNIKIYNNSFWGGIASSYDGTMDVQNNIFYADTCMALFAGKGFLGKNNNYYRSTAGFTASIDNFFFRNPDSIYTATGNEKYSISVDPQYVSATNLHSQSPFLQGRASVLSEVPDDIDGELRDPSTPDIGADEFTAAFINTSPVIISTNPINNSTNLPLNTEFKLNFNRRVGYHDGFINLYKSSDNTLVAAIPLNGDNIIRVDSNTMKFYITDLLEKNTRYYFTFNENTFYSVGMGNNAITNPTFFTFKTGNTVDIADHTTSNLFEVYPNPSQGSVHIQFNKTISGQTHHVRITDITGHEIYSDYMNTDTEISLQGLSKGLYIMKFSSEDYTQNIKLILE